MSKRINLFADYVLPLITVVVTVVLFFLFCPEEETALFYVNMVYAVVLEAIFFVWLNFGRKGSEDTSVVFRIVSGVLSGIYVFAGFVWMLLYGLLLSDILSLKYYVAVIIILTLIWVIVGTLIAQTDSNYKKGVDLTQNATLTLASLSAKVNQLCSRCEQAYIAKGRTYKNENHLKSPVAKLKLKVSCLTPNVFRDANALSRLQTLLNECEDCINEFASAENSEVEAMEKKLESMIDRTVSEIDFIKQSTRL